MDCCAAASPPPSCRPLHSLPACANRQKFITKTSPRVQESIMLKGKSAVVTGSTSGIGLAIARALAKEGANVMINGFGDKTAIETERAGIEKDFGVKSIYSGADMSKPPEIVEMIKTAEKTLGSVDVLVNNAGIQHVAPIEEFPVDKWDMIIAINLNAAFHTIRTAVPGMKARKWGRIINTASAHSLVASPPTASAPATSGRRWSRSRFPIP